MATRRRLRTACVDRNCDPSLTVGEYLASWLELCEGRGLRPASIASYGVTIRTTIAPRLGRIQLESITPHDLNRLYRSLLRDGRRDGRGGLSPRTVRYAHAILRKAFADTMKDREFIAEAEKSKLETTHVSGERSTNMWTRCCRLSPRPKELFDFLMVKPKK